jgi:hypothetical protein
MCLNGTYSNVRISKHLYDKFPVQNGLKHGDDLSPLFHILFRYAVRKVPEDWGRFKTNWARSALLLIHWAKTDNYTVKKDTEAL